MDFSVRGKPALFTRVVTADAVLAREHAGLAAGALHTPLHAR
jgi:hypothetical protein